MDTSLYVCNKPTLCHNMQLLWLDEWKQKNFQKIDHSEIVFLKLISQWYVLCFFFVRLRGLVLRYDRDSQLHLALEDVRNYEFQSGLWSHLSPWLFNVKALNMEKNYMNKSLSWVHTWNLKTLPTFFEDY